MTKAAIAVVLAARILTAQPVHRAGELDNLYQSNRWFEFRDAMLHDPPPTPFYRGQLALAFHDWPQAEKDLLAAMKPGADPMQAFEAGMGLLRIYEFSGRRKDGRALLAKMDRLMQSFEKTRSISSAALRNFENYRAALSAATDYPDQSVVARGRSRLLYTEIENQLIVPLHINGAPANYMVDTGAESCFISAAEAKRLGLTVQPTSIEIGGFDPDAKAAGVAVANDLTIGNFHLRNVLFLVQEGDDEASGALGLPVLLAFETLRWNSDGTMEFGFPAQPRNFAESNLALAGSLLWTLADLEGKKLLLGVDTGSYESMLFPGFAREFAGRMNSPVPLGSRDAPDGTVALSLSGLRVGGLRTPLNPAPVYAKDPLEAASDLHGWLGMDLLGQARSVTLDLAAMKLTLDGIDGAIFPSADCPLPPDFRCMTGFACTVKAVGTEPCFVERVPVEAAPGNKVKSEPGGAGNCDLPEGAQCEHGMLCRAVFDTNSSCHILRERAVPPAPGKTIPSPAAPEAPVPPPSLPTATPDVRDIVQRSLKYESLDLAPPRNYIYIEDEEEKRLGADGSVKSVTREAHEVMHLYGAPVSRLISKDGKELPPDKARAEQARFDKAVASRSQAQERRTPEEKAKRQEARRKANAEELLCQDEFLKMFDPHLSGSETLNGRPAWIVELKPLPDAAPQCKDLKILTKFNFKVWIDQSEYRWARFEGDNVAPVSWGKILVRVPTEGLHLLIEQTRHDDGAWLESEEHVKVNARLLLAAAFRMDIRTTYSGYRKFQADSRIMDDGK